MKLPQPAHTTSLASNTARLLFAALTLVGLIASAVPAGAQAESTKLTARTGLYGLYDGHTVQISVVESDPNAEAAEVLLLLIDGNDRILARKVRTLKPGKPVQLRFASTKLPILGRRTPIRVEAHIVARGSGTPDFPIRNAPILSVEFHNERTGDLTIGPTCPLPFSEEPAGRGPILPSCGPCQVKIEPLPILP